MDELTSTSLKAVIATEENTAEYGVFVGPNVKRDGLPIPFYDHVQEGANLPFEYTGKAKLRTAIISPTKEPVKWLERHFNLTQLFLGLGNDDFAIVLGKPTSSELPDLSTTKCFVFSGGTGIIIHKGVWHDFPIAIANPFTCFLANSSNVIDALTSVKSAREMDEGDVQKIDLRRRMGTDIRVVP